MKNYAKEKIKGIYTLNEIKSSDKVISDSFNDTNNTISRENGSRQERLIHCRRRSIVCRMIMCVKRLTVNDKRVLDGRMREMREMH